MLLDKANLTIYWKCVKCYTKLCTISVVGDKQMQRYYVYNVLFLNYNLLSMDQRFRGFFYLGRGVWQIWPYRKRAFFKVPRVNLLLLVYGTKVTVWMRLVFDIMFWWTRKIVIYFDKYNLDNNLKLKYFIIVIVYHLLNKIPWLLLYEIQ